MSATIGVATLKGGVVFVRVRAEGPNIVGDLIETVSQTQFEADGWRTDGPLREGEGVQILAHGTRGRGIKR